MKHVVEENQPQIAAKSVAFSEDGIHDSTAFARNRYFLLKPSSLGISVRELKHNHRIGFIWPMGRHVEHQ